jgi:signal transduction histidine kinase
MTDSGEAVMGGVNGLFIVDTQEIQDNIVLPNLVVTDFRVFSDSVGVDGEDGLLSKAINHTKSIVLNHTQSVFEFEFSALNYRDTEKNQYAYKLSGFDADWIYVGSQRRAKYTNLDPGTYVFHVKGSNNDAYWSENDTSITIRILPPWWLSVWAYAIYAGLALLLMYWAFHTYQTKIAFEQEKLLRTTEKLKKEREIQSAKMAGLTSLVAGMAHEFNNPLNFFKAGSYNIEMDVTDIRDILTELFSESGDDDSKELFEEFEEKFSSIFYSLSSMHDGTERIKLLVDDLHAFSRIGQDSPERISADALLKPLAVWIEMHYPEIVSFSVKISEDCQVLCCVSSIQKAFSNIIENSCQAIITCPENNSDLPRLGVSVLVNATERDVVFEFTDEGCGMTEKDLKHLFEPFYTGKPVGEGTGLGLAIAYSAIEGDGGNIKAESVLGKGTKIIVMLPKAMT